MKESKVSKIRSGLVRKQQFIFIAMLGVGAALIIASQLTNPLLISNGIAFITIGFVGILMSWTTFDIGSSIKEAVYEVGKQNKEALDMLAQSNERMIQSQERSEKFQERMIQSQERSEKFQERMIQSQERTAETQKKTLELLERILKNTERSD